MVSRLLVPALLLALTGPGFDGCQGGPTGGVVPPGMTVACFTDSDCDLTSCQDIRCIASECRVVAEMRDGDADGHAPLPCGDDCDDADTRVFPGADETCDLRDQDCDMHIDEGAAPGVQRTLLGTASQSLSAAAVGSSIVVTDTGFGPGVRIRAIDFAGHVGAAVPVLTETIELVDIATTDAGGVVVVAFATPTMRHAIASYPIDISAAGVLTVHPPDTVASLADGDQAVRLRVEPAGTSFVVVWDDANGNRWARMPSWTGPIAVAAMLSSGVPFDAASDGTTIAIPSAATTMSFYALADGAVVGTQTFATGLANEPVTATPSDYIVAFHDSFDHQLARMTPTMVGMTRTAPSQGNGLPLRIDETALGPLVTRFDTTGLRRMGNGVFALLLPETLDSVRVDFPPSSVSAGASGPPLSFDVVSSPAGTAVITNFGMSGAVLAVLACEAH